MTIPTISLTPDILGYIGPVPVTDTLINTYLVMGFLIVVALLVRLGIREKGPISGLQNFFELVVEGVLGQMQSMMSAKQARQVFGIVCTIFLFVLVQNWSGLIPGFEAVEYSPGGTAEALHVLRPASSDLSFTLALALIAVVLTQFYGVQALGVWGYLKKFISFKNPMAFVVGILELVSEFTKIISFTFRLFGNIFAGKVLLLVMMAIVPFFVPIPFYGMEIFVGFIQALVFAALTTVFFKLATEEAH